MSNDVATASMSEHDAQRLTERIRLTAHNYAEARQKLQELVAEAKEGNAHLALGYESWTAYLAEVLGEEPMRLARGERQGMVQMLTYEGVGPAAIAPIVGVSERQVRRDIGQMSEVPEASTGLDGKTYTRPDPTPKRRQEYADGEKVEPSKPKRRPITEQSSEAGWELAKSVERIERILTDDRFPQNREVVSGHLKQHLINSITTLDTLLNTL